MTFVCVSHLKEKIHYIFYKENVCSFYYGMSFQISFRPLVVDMGTYSNAAYLAI